MEKDSNQIPTKSISQIMTDALALINQLRKLLMVYSARHLSTDRMITCANIVQFCAFLEKLEHLIKCEGVCKRAARLVQRQVTCPSRFVRATDADDADAIADTRVQSRTLWLAICAIVLVK